MPDRVLGKNSGIGKAQLVAVEQLIRHVPEGANSLLAPIDNVVKTLSCSLSALR